MSASASLQCAPPAAKKARVEPTGESQTIDVAKCEALIERIWKADTSEMFHQPVDAKAVPNYYTVISDPVDLSTIRSRLRSGHYATSRQMIQDVQLMFQNAREFNTKGDAWYSHAKRMAKALPSHLRKVGLRADDDDDDDEVFVPDNSVAAEDKENGLAKAERKVKEDVPALLKALEEEQEIPLEELRARYQKNAAAAPVVSDDEEEDDDEEDEEDDDDDEEDDEELSTTDDDDDEEDETDSEA